MEEICVTVGVCARNSANTIQEAITSIANQGFPHNLMELVIVDDGSADKTLEILQQLVSTTNTHTTIHSQRWRGLGVARNVIVQNARGRYIVWVDSDMKLPKDHVEKQVEFMERNPNVGAAKARYLRVNSKNTIVTLENCRDLFLRESSHIVGTGGAIYRVEAIREIGGFDPNIRGAGEDVDALLRMKEAGWLLSRTEAEFLEQFKERWEDLWREYYWWGYGAHYVWHKHRGQISFTSRLPPVSFLAGLGRSLFAFKLYRRMVYLLLPFQNAFKDAAWILGFIRSHRKGYGHIFYPKQEYRPHRECMN